MTASRFWQRVTRLESGCWRYMKTREGYYGSVTTHDGRTRAAHRYAYELTHGAIPPGMLVRHRCDHTFCCNPDHLELGTHKDNTADMMRKGRQVPGRRGPRLPVYRSCR